jgi:hypothetical protein
MYSNLDKNWEKPISIDTLKILDKLSNRATNVCKTASLNTLNKILSFYKKNKTFRIITNCGEKTDKELISLSEKYIINFIDINIYSDLDKNFGKPISIDTLKILDKLSNRATNVCKKASLNTLNKILFFYKKNKTFRIITNCGKKTDKELISLSIKYINNLIFVNDNYKDIKNNDINNFFKIKEFAYHNFKIKKNKINFYESLFFEKKFPLFKFILLLLKKGLSERNFYIFEHISRLFKNEAKLSLYTIGKKVNITKERARQIKIETILKIEKPLTTFFKKMDFLTDYIDLNIDFKTNLQILNQDFFSNINNKKNVNFSYEFYSLAIALIYKKSHLSLCLENKQKIYMINKKLTNQFNFSLLFDDLNNKRIKKSYIQNFDKYITNCSHKTDKNIDDYNEINKIIKKIIAEFESVAYLTKDNNRIIFKRNLHRKKYDYVIEKLLEFDRPMNNYELYREINITNPGIFKNKKDMVGRKSYSKDEVICFGKIGNYGLKDWLD